MVECKELIKKIKSKQLVNEKIEYEHIFKDTQKQKNIIMMFTQLLKIRQNKNEENCPCSLQNQNYKVLKNGINIQNFTNLSFGKWNKQAGAELGQAQLKMELDFTLIFLDLAW